MNVLLPLTLSANQTIDRAPDEALQDHPAEAMAVVRRLQVLVLQILLSLWLWASTPLLSQSNNNFLFFNPSSPDNGNSSEPKTPFRVKELIKTLTETAANIREYLYQSEAYAVRDKPKCPLDDPRVDDLKEVKAISVYMSGFERYGGSDR